jgi:hypothetical protein
MDPVFGTKWRDSQFATAMPAAQVHATQCPSYCIFADDWLTGLLARQ